jgi:hypothetical protein
MPTICCSNMLAICYNKQGHKDLTPIPSPKARGNTEDQSEDHPEGFAAIFEFPLLSGRL